MSIFTHNIKLSPTQKYILMFVLGIFSGSIIFILQNDILLPSMALYHELNSDRLTSSNVNSLELLKYITEKRLHEFIILFLTQITLLKCPAACCHSFLYGFSGAMLEGFYVQQYGPKGIVLFLLTVIPHFLFYALAWHKICNEKFFEAPITNYTLLANLKSIATCILFIFAGMVCESTLNLWVLKKLYKFLL